MKVVQPGAGLLASVLGRLRSDRTFIDNLKTFGGYDEIAARKFETDANQGLIETVLFMMRGLTRRPFIDISVTGTNEITAALAEGAGAILWIADMIYIGNISKIGLRNTGFDIHHLSRPDHGFSHSQFAMSVLNPVRIGYEMRYLSSRIVIHYEKPTKALRQIKSVLGKNGIVSIGSAIHGSNTELDIPFLGGITKLPSGAPRIAESNGTPILPVFIRKGSGNNRFELIIEPALNRPISKTGATTEQLMEIYLQRLHPHVRSDPALWRGWANLRAR